ncbi:MAG: hypothetical protein WA736_16920, partial [Candidatus Acidiferrum sp.]
MTVPLGVLAFTVTTTVKAAVPRAGKLVLLLYVHVITLVTSAQFQLFVPFVPEVLAAETNVVFGGRFWVTVSVSLILLVLLVLVNTWVYVIVPPGATVVGAAVSVIVSACPAAGAALTNEANRIA